MKVEQWPIDKPIPYARNPRKISDAAITKVASSLREFGWRQPIVVDRDGVVVVGHTRLEAARKLGLDAVPVHVASDMSPQQAKAYRLTDNRTSEEADWDMDLLPLELGELSGDNYDLALTAFNPDELSEIMFPEDVPDFSPVGADEQGRLDEKKKVTCPGCGHEFAP